MPYPQHPFHHTATVPGPPSAAPPYIPLRYMIAFIFPITATMKQFLAAGGHDPETVEAMHAAWFKAVTLHVCLWSQPYGPEVW